MRTYGHPARLSQRRTHNSTHAHTGPHIAVTHTYMAHPRARLRSRRISFAHNMTSSIINILSTSIPNGSMHSISSINCWDLRTNAVRHRVALSLYMLECQIQFGNYADADCHRHATPAALPILLLRASLLVPPGMRRFSQHHHMRARPARESQHAQTQSMHAVHLIW